MSQIPSLAIFAAILGVAWVRRPRRHRLTGGAEPSPATRVGRVLGRLVGARADDAAAATMGRAALAAAAVAVVAPLLAVAVVAGGLIAPVLARRRAAVAHEEAVVRELPEAIDLLRLALESTGSVRLAVGAAGDALEGPVGVMCRRAAAAGADERFVYAIEAGGDSLGRAGRPLVRALAGAEHYGVGLVPTLERLGAEARRQRRRQAETTARRVPVRLLVPLVFCILPAFVLLTLVPVLARTLLSLELGG